MDKLYEAMSMLSEYREQDKPVSEILIDSIYVVPGYAFVTEYQGKRYMLINKSDFDRLSAGLEAHHRELLTQHWTGIPVFEDREKVGKIVCGIFERAMSMRNTWRPS